MLNGARRTAFSQLLKRHFSSTIADGGDGHLPLEFSLVAALKSSATSLRFGEPLHAFALKSGLVCSNLFVRNALLNLYAKCGRLAAASLLFYSPFPSPARDAASWNIMIAAHAKAGRLADARNLFDAAPDKDRVAFTTMIMALAQAGHPVEALAVFHDMAAAGLTPNEVTLASVLAACSRSSSARGISISHAVAAKCGLDEYVLVATNLVHGYAVCSQLSDSRTVFDRMPERNTVTWNAMLNGYAKAGLIDEAVDLFKRIPERDLVSWSTMIDGYLKVDKLEEALITYCGMLQNADGRPNEVLLVDLVSACGRFSAVREGRQLHAAVAKTGLDCYDFMQATLIHFYGACDLIDLACLQFESGRRSHVSSWNALMAGLVRNNMVDAARELFNGMPERDVVSWSTLIAGYVQCRKSDTGLELFREMLSLGFEPNEITLVSVLSAVASSGTLEQGKWIHDYIINRAIPLTDNLSAGLIDMYAKHGRIGNAMQVFDHVKEGSVSVSPWNAVICGLAMHGYADISLSIFSDLQRRKIKPNSITFIGVLGACCHVGLVDAGRCYFKSMKRKYNIEPTIKHYGCMIDLLGRSGLLEEAEQLIKTMPMQADVVIWGSLLAAARTHGNLEVGERAADNLARLDPTHGAARVLLSNIYADAGRWSDVFLVRRAMQSGRLKKMPGCSGIL